MEHKTRLDVLESYLIAKGYQYEEEYKGLKKWCKGDDYTMYCYHGQIYVAKQVVEKVLKDTGGSWGELGLFDPIVYK